VFDNRRSTAAAWELALCGDGHTGVVRVRLESIAVCVAAASVLVAGCSGTAKNSVRVSAAVPTEPASSTVAEAPTTTVAGVAGLTGGRGLIGVAGGPGIDWDNPEDGTPVDAAAAARKVKFSVAVPAAAGAVQGMWLAGDPQAPFVAFKLAGPMGRLLLMRDPAQTTQAGLEAEATAYPQVESLVHIVGDPNAVEAIAGWPESSLIWLEGNVLVTLIGESTNYSVDALRSEAAKLYGSAQLAG